MRVVLFFAYLFIHLLGGGSYLHAATHHNNTDHTAVSNLSQKEPIKFTDPDHHISTIIEDADLDLDEEHLSGANIKAGNSYKYTEGKYCLSAQWHLAGSRPYITSCSNSYLKIFPLFCGYSSPIYIRQRTLRI